MSKLMNLNTNTIKFLKFLAVVLLLSSTIAIATETTWRHSGFEVAQYDINLTSIFNITELRVLEWGWNSSTPSVSDSNRAKMYYDNNQKRIMHSIDGGAFEATVTNSTVNPYSFNATNATGTLADARLSGNVLLGSNTTVLRDNNASILLDTNKTILTDRNASILLDTNNTILTDSNNSILVRQKVDSCTAANDALGWNNTGLNCKTITTSGYNNTEVNTNTTLFNGTYYANASLGELVLSLPDATGLNYITLIYAKSRQQYEYGGTNYTNNVSVVTTFGQNITGIKKYYNLTSVGDSVTFMSSNGNWSVAENTGCLNCNFVQASLTAQASQADAFNCGSGNNNARICRGIEIINNGITGTWSVRFGFAVEGVASATHYARVYLNNRPLGRLWQTSTIYTTDYDNVNEYFNIPLRTNDKVQLWSVGASADTPRFRDFNLSFSYMNATPSFIVSSGS